MGVFRKISEYKGTLQMALCTVIKTTGSAPRKAASKMLVWEDGSIYKTIGGGDLEKKVIENALGVIEQGKAAYFEHKLNYDHGMCCGGSVSLFIEPILRKKKLYIFGAGHTGKALAGFADDLDFDVTVIDERVEIVDDLQLSEDVVIVEKAHKLAFKSLDFDENTFIVVLTHNHQYDKEIVAHCALQPHGYLGMIGSKRKVEVAKKGFRVGNVLTEAQMDAIDWPIGLDIKVHTPEEIAVSILGKLIHVRNTQGDPEPKTSTKKVVEKKGASKAQ